jgi:hypothetical protein
MELSESYSNVEIILPCNFSNLRYLSIEMCSIRFDEFEMFIIESECNLKTFRIIIQSDDKDYLDADRWKDLILDYLPRG